MNQDNKDVNDTSDRENPDKKDDLAKAVTDMKISSTQKPSEQGIIIEANGTSYECVARSGKGSFGIVYKAVEVGTSKVVAIKRVLQDPRYKNRELQIMRMVNHPNIVQLLDSFYERSKKDGEVYLNLVLGFVPKNLYEVSSSFTKRNEKMPVDHIQVRFINLHSPLSFTFINFVDRLLMFTHLVFVIGILNLRTYSSIPLLTNSSCVISEAQKYL